MIFSKNVPMTSKRTIKALWGAEEVAEPEKYLGLPQMVGQARSRNFRILNKKCGKNYKIGKKKFCHNEARKS